MKKINLYSLFITILVLSCEGPYIEVPDNSDSIAPILTLTFPASQSTVSDTVKITAYAFDNIELELVTVYLNDSAIINAKEAPFEFDWNTLDYSEDEYHTIYAKAIDVAGNINQISPIQVLVDNHDNVNPTGALIFPFTGQTLNGEITIIIEADDNEGIDFVNIYINGDTVANLTESPYTFLWDTSVEIDDILYTIHSHIQDVTGNRITLGPINVLIDNYETADNIAPTGIITNPPSASTVSGTVNIQISAYDNIEMGYVDFIIDGSAVAQVSSFPYEYSWDTTEEIEDADHIININLTDAAGNSTSLFPVTVYIDNVAELDITPPAIVIYDPAANQTVSGIVKVSTIATDNEGINRVEFYINHELSNTSSNSPYSFDWNTTLLDDDTEYSLYVKAFDTSENFTQTQPISVFVNNDDNITPTGFILYPYAGQTVSGTIEIQISASDNVGIAQVEFFIDGNSVGTDNDESYNFFWNTESFSEDNDHIISITITDLSGNYINLSPIAVFVNNIVTPEDDITPPVVAILTPVSGQTVEDTVFISGFAADNVGIDYVQFLIDDALISTDSDSPYTYNWNTYELANYSDHIIQMVARDIAGNETNAQPIIVTVQNEYNEQIQSLSLSVSENNISLSWDSPNNATSFKVYRDNVFVIETTNQTFDDAVIGGIEYCYTISAVNSVEIEGPISAEQCGIAILAAPISFTASVDDTTVTLVWNSIENASGYSLNRDNVEIMNGSPLTFTDSELEHNSTYIYTVTAFDMNSTNGTTSEPITVTTHAALISPVLSLTVSGTDGNLTWTSVSSAVAYRLYKDSNFIAEIDVTQYEIELTHAVETCFTVLALNEYGTLSELSNSECGTGELTPPTLSLTVTDSTAALNWNTILSAINYKIYQNDTFLIETTNTNYSLNIGTGVQECFKISAVNNYGTESNASNQECGTGF